MPIIYTAVRNTILPSYYIALPIKRTFLYKKKKAATKLLSKHITHPNQKSIERFQWIKLKDHPAMYHVSDAHKQK